VVWVVVSAVPIFEKGAIKEVFVSFMDITERKRAERERAQLLEVVSEKAAETEAVLASQSDVVILYDTNMNARRVNPAFTSIYGFDPIGLNLREIIKRVSCRLLDGTPLILEEQPTPRALHGEKPKPSIFMVTRGDGSTGIVETTSQPMRMNDTIMGTVTVWHDITELKRAEEALRRNEQRLQLIVENAPFVVGVCDPQGKVYFINKRHEELFGYPLEKIPTVADWLRLAYPDENYRREVEAQWNADIRRVQSGELSTAPTRLYRITDVKGKVKDVEISFSLTGGYMYVLFYDVSELKQAQENLRIAKEEAEKATQLKDKFVSLVSHDLKGPLSSMLGLLNMAVAENQSLEDRQKIDVIKAAVSSGERMRSIIEDLLGVSRLRAGVVKMDMAFVNPYVLTGNAIASLREMADKKKVVFENNIPVISRIYADPALLEEVMRNILSNAVKFCHLGGNVRIYIPRGELSTIAVADDGVGIPHEKIGKLFSYEEKNSTPGTSGEMGTGLGLPLCRDIMEAMRGQIRVESSVGSGSVFYVSLPYKRPVVMVVDDDPVQVMLMTTMLNTLQVDFATAYSGTEALKTLEARSPNIVIADIMMSGMDGYELMEGIRKRPGFDKTPVILITSRSDIETRNTAFQKGANDFITKPLMADELIPRVRRFIW
jgi:PAS domain S-box-containing protein